MRLTSSSSSRSSSPGWSLNWERRERPLPSCRWSYIPLRGARRQAPPPRLPCPFLEGSSNTEGRLSPRPATGQRVQPTSPVRLPLDGRQFGAVVVLDDHPLVVGQRAVRGGHGRAGQAAVREPRGVQPVGEGGPRVRSRAPLVPRWGAGQCWDMAKQFRCWVGRHQWVNKWDHERSMAIKECQLCDKRMLRGNPPTLAGRPWDLQCDPLATPPTRSPDLSQKRSLALVVVADHREPGDLPAVDPHDGPTQRVLRPPAFGLPAH